MLKGFSWDLGHSQAFNLHVIQMASLLGSCGISFVIVLFNRCLYKFVIKKKERILYAIVILWSLSLVFGYGFLSLHFESRKEGKAALNILAIQPRIDSKEKADLNKVERFIDEQIAITEEGLVGATPDLIVWPETAVSSDFLQNKDWGDKIRRLIEQIKRPMLIGAALFEEERDFNSAVLLDAQGQMVDVYHKRYLVPFSEYLPKGVVPRILSKLFGIQNYSFSPGWESGLVEFPGKKGVVFGTLICSEDTIGSLFHEYSQDGADFIVVLLNDDWFKQERALILHAQNAVMHAVENSISVIRVSNSGWSCYIDPHGRINNIENPQMNQRTAMVFSVSEGEAVTFYNLIGDTFCGLCLCFVIMNLIMGWRGRVGKND